MLASSILTHKVCLCHHSDVKPKNSHLFYCSLVDLLNYLFRLFQELSRLSSKGHNPLVCLFDKILLKEIGFEQFYCFPEVFCFLFIFHLHLMVSASYIPKHLYISFWLVVLILFWFGSSIHSVICLFPLLLCSMVHFFLCQILSVQLVYSRSSVDTLLLYICRRWFLFEGLFGLEKSFLLPIKSGVSVSS